MAGWGAMTSPISRLAQRLWGYPYDPEGVLDDARFLVDTCPMIEATLGDAMEREIHDKSVKLWLCDLKYLAADAEDLLEECEYHLVEEDASSAARSDVDKIEFGDELSQRLRWIRKRFEDISTRRTTLCLGNDFGHQHLETSLERQVGHLSNEPIIYGRDNDKNKLVDFLKRDNLWESLKPNQKGDEYVGVAIGLVGVGGIGKTTLAQALYNDVRISEYFDCKVWITVSDQTFDVVRIAKDMLRSLTGLDLNWTQLSAIQDRLERRLQGKKFFLVLDDIWEEKCSSLGFLLRMGLRGSKILTTTRIKRVAQAVHPTIIYDVGPLTVEDGWLLFCRHAFQGEDDEASDQLIARNYFEKMGREIARKCGGLPLLLKVLGDDLREADADENRWREMLNHETWKIKDDSGNNKVMEILMFSYVHLPMTLRQCFLHCSIFPKGYEFRKDELGRLWTAYGGQVEEDMGVQVNGLLQRSFIQQRGRYKYSWYMRKPNETFSLHDVMHDLAQYVLEGEQSLTKNRASTFDLHRALMSQEHDAHSVQKSRCCYEPIAGRTFLDQLWYPSKAVIASDINVHLQRLRVLILEDQFLKAIPDSIGDLKHLRYLCLRTPWLKKLPDSICSLHNLQTLECQYVEELPRDIGKLKRLHHLLVNLAKMPLGFGQLVELQTLKKFRVTRGGDHAGLSDLKNLGWLAGEFKISGLNNVDNVEEAKLSNMCYKPDLQHLMLEWDPVKDDDDCPRPNWSVLDYLKPHDHLEELVIYFYAGARFPKWLGSTSFARLTTVHLFYCSKCEILPAFGLLPSLRYLDLKDMHCLDRIGPEFYGRSPSGAFQSLQQLLLTNMYRLREWWGMDKCHFPQLVSLHFCSCPLLRFDVEPHDVQHMFDTVQNVYVVFSPPLQEWCRAHACTTLANVKLLDFGDEEFYFPRRGAQTFRYT